MQVRGETIAGTVVNPVVTVLGIIGTAKGRVDKAIHGVVSTAAHGATRLVEVEIAKS